MEFPAGEGQIRNASKFSLYAALRNLSASSWRNLMTAAFSLRQRLWSSRLDIKNTASIKMTNPPAMSAKPMK